MTYIMRKNIFLYLCVAGLLSLSSCDGFLEEESRSDLTFEDYYNTEAQAIANVNRLYWEGAPRRISDAGSAYVGPKASINGMLTGYFINNYEGQEVVCKYARELTRQDYLSNVSGTVNNIWDKCYLQINAANGAINYIPKINMDAGKIKTLVGEAKFFRAFNYFYLVKTFGDVPLTLDLYENSSDDLYLSRTAVSEVYKLIESDLKEAVEVLPALKFAENGHRITKYAAAMMLTNVYLQQGKYKEAADYAKIVVASPHQLTQNEDMALKSAFNKLRTTDDLDEVIYSQEYDATIRDGSWWPTYSFNSKAVSIFDKYSICERVYGPINRYLNVYEDNDLRIQPQQFFHWEYKNPNNGKEWKAEEGDLAGCWYYFEEEAMLTTGKATKDWNFFRYSEALLAAAEAIAQSEGVTDEATRCLAEVKARSDINGKTVDQYKAELLSMQKDAFVEECWTERLREFPLEFKIWDDCLRTGKFPYISETEKGKVTYVDLVGATNASGAVFKESDLLWPISLDELQRNKNLTQNKGYEIK